MKKINRRNDKEIRELQEEIRRLIKKIKRNEKIIKKYKEIIKRQKEMIKRQKEIIRKNQKELRRIQKEIRRKQKEIRRIQKEERRRRINENNEETNNILNQLILTKIADINKLNDENKKCVICLEDFKNNDKSIYLPCFHLFHEKCITDWINMNKRFCPFCKTIINNMMK